MPMTRQYRFQCVAVTLVAVATAFLTARYFNRAQSLPAPRQAGPAQRADAAVVANHGPLAEAPEGDWIDDRRLQQAFQHGVDKLIADGRAPEMSVVQEGLSQSTCTVTLPAGEELGDEPKTGEVIYEKSRPAVALVGSTYKCSRCDQWHIDGATGFFISADGVLVTNYHVVASDDRRALFAMTFDGRVFPVTKTLAADKSADVALVQVEPLDQQGASAKFAVLPLAETSRVGQRVRVISHPDGNHFAMSEGAISRRFFTPHHGGSCWLAITADYAKGSSGGPLLDDAGHVVGLVCSTAGVYYDQDDAGHPRNLQMVWKQCVPVESLRKLIRDP